MRPTISLDVNGLMELMAALCTKGNGEGMRNAQIVGTGRYDTRSTVSGGCRKRKKRVELDGNLKLFEKTVDGWWEQRDVIIHWALYVTSPRPQFPCIMAGAAGVVLPF